MEVDSVSPSFYWFVSNLIDKLGEELERKIPCYLRIKLVGSSAVKKILGVEENCVLYSVRFLYCSEESMSTAKEIIQRYGFKIEHIAWTTNGFAIYFSMSRR
ncbi:MAG: hypothetical protein Q6363_008230 [Candidatus Njordarchaeota archaeon]